MFGVAKILRNNYCNINTFIQQECIQLIKSDRKKPYIMWRWTSNRISNKRCSFELSIR